MSGADTPEIMRGFYEPWCAMSSLTRKEFEEINIELCTTGRISTPAAHEVVAYARAADWALRKIDILCGTDLSAPDIERLSDKQMARAVRVQDIARAARLGGGE